MNIPFDQNIKELSNVMSVPLYAVGGCVRDFIINGEKSSDIDVCSTLSPEDFSALALSFGFKITATYKRTGTVVIEKAGKRYEYSVTRSEEYLSGGKHTPNKTVFGVSIDKDAVRRDFKCNAIYYDIKNNLLVDPLNGLKDIKNKVLSAVIEPQKVFCHDGLRLMRLARFSGELGFSVEPATLKGAKSYAKNILDISPERICEELKKILLADTKHLYSPSNGHYLALKVLSESRVLDYILPELTRGRDMPQRADFHKYDVLEHSLRCALYADVSIRLPALLHDIGKPEQFLKTGKYHAHAEQGERLAKEFLEKYRFDKKTVEQTAYLVKTHMLDLECNMCEDEVRRHIVELGELYDKAILLKVADCRAGQDKEVVPPTVVKWNKIRNQMLNDGTPFSVKDLKITANDLIKLGYKGERLGKQLNKLLELSIVAPKLNEFEKLMEISVNTKN